MKIIIRVILPLIIILIIIRLMLPHYVLKYVVKQVNKIPEYHAEIKDLNMNLWRGSYTLVDIQLWKIKKNIPVPFFKCPAIDFSIEWSAILHGKLVAKIVADSPVLNFVSDPSKNNEQLTIDDYWITIVKSLFPLNINRLDVHNGKIYFRSFKGDPPFNTYIDDIEFTIQNMQKVEKTASLLSSSYTFTGDTIGKGKIESAGKYNPFSKTPTFDIYAKLNSLSISNIAPLLKHYTHIDVTGGTFSLYAEVAAAKGNITGYAKPFIKNIKIGNPKKENPIEAVYNTVVAGVAGILENPKKKTIATKINFSGRVDDPNTSIWSIIGYMLRHAFIQGLIPQIDNSIDIQNVIYKTPPQKFPQFRR